jgi:hypothetical protein
LTTKEELTMKDTVAQKQADIRSLARECALEAIEQGATEIAEPLPGDWEYYYDEIDSRYQDDDTFREAYKATLRENLD